MDIATFAKGFDAVHLGVSDIDIVTIPNGRPALVGHLDVLEIKTVVMPERITENL